MGRCDSFVVETDVHYPTDINLLFDAVRKMIQLAALISQTQGQTLWRQYEYNIRSFKKLFRRAQQLKRSTSKDKKKKAIREELIINAHKIYVEADNEDDAIYKFRNKVQAVDASIFNVEDAE